MSDVTDLSDVKLPGKRELENCFILATAGQVETGVTAASRVSLVFQLKGESDGDASVAAHRNLTFVGCVLNRKEEEEEEEKENIYGAHKLKA